MASDAAAFACHVCTRVCMQHVYHTWTAKDIANEENELKAFDKLSKSILDDTKWGWRTLDGQAELEQEVRSLRFCPSQIPACCETVFL